VAWRGVVLFGVLWRGMVSCAQVAFMQSWVEQHLAHLMPHPPAGFTMEQQDSMDRLHKVATYMLEVREWLAATHKQLSYHFCLCFAFQFMPRLLYT
jgi:hypothetical protein